MPTRDGTTALLPTCSVCGKRMVRSGRAIAALRQNPHIFDFWMHEQCQKAISGAATRKKGARIAVTILPEPEKVAEQQKPKETKKEKARKIATSLIGYDKVLNDVADLIDFGTKGVFLGGYHGLGKTTMVYDLAKHYNAEVIRIQVTELLTEIDIVGSIDIQSGKFIYSEFVQKILEAKENPEKLYFVLLDEFTRGREEALNILFPLMAEKILFINSPYSEHKKIELPKNVKVFGTGNIKDTGIREVGQAEFDRWNGVEILPLTENNQVLKLVEDIQLPEDAQARLFDVYDRSWIYGAESRILPMSHRTFIEVARLTDMNIKRGWTTETAIKHALSLTYYTSSQAILNPQYKMTYDQIVREAL